MIIVENKEILSALHMDYWLKSPQSGPTPSETNEVWYDPNTGEVVFQTSYSEYSHKIDPTGVTHDSIISEELKKWKDMPMREGTILFLWYEIIGVSSSSVATSLGGGVWILENGVKVWISEIYDWREVLVTIDWD